MTSDLWRFFVDPASVGLGPRLHSALALIVCAACVCLICTPVGAHSGKAFLQVGKCSFGTCLKQILTATSFEWSHRWFKVLGENRILVTIQNHILFLWSQRRQDAFSFSHPPFFILCPDHCKNTPNSQFFLLLSRTISTFVPAFQQKAGESAESLVFCIYLLPQCSQHGLHSGRGERCSVWNIWPRFLWVI